MSSFGYFEDGIDIEVDAIDRKILLCWDELGACSLTLSLEEARQLRDDLIENIAHIEREVKNSF